MMFPDELGCIEINYSPWLNKRFYLGFTAYFGLFSQ